MKRFLALVVIVLIAGLGPLAAQGVPPGPMGLGWGMSSDEVEALGVTMTPHELQNFGVVMKARNLPRVLNDVDAVFLFFGHDNRLWRVFASSTQFDNDRTGFRIKQRFNELADLLTERYGKADVFDHEPTNEYMRDPEDFARSISSNERILASMWDTGDVRVELVVAAELWDTFYTLAYEYKPLASGARATIKAQDKDAL